MIKALLLSSFFSATALAQAQVQLQLNIPLPTITFTAPPPMVVVQPGVQVVQDYDDEVFFVDNYYWHRRDGHWFRTRTHNGGWVVVEERQVPRAIYVVPVGKYRRWHGARPVGAPGTVVVMPPPPGGRDDRGHGSEGKRGHGSEGKKGGKKGKH